MNGSAGVPLLLVAAALIVLGIAWGANTQDETFLGQEQQEQQQAAGSLVAISGLVVGIGLGIVPIALGRSKWTTRSLMALQVALAGWAFTFLIQADYPNYNAFTESQTATLSESTLLLEGAGSPTVLLPVMVAGLIAFWAIVDGVQRGMGPVGKMSLGRLQQRQVAGASLAIPFWLVTAVGSIAVLLSIPGEEAGAGLAYLLLPLLAACAVALAVMQMLRVWHLSNFVADPRLAPFTREVWRTIGRIETAVIAVVILGAILSSAMPRLETPATNIGRALSFTLRSHGQGLFFMLAPIVPLLLVQRQLAGRLDETTTPIERPADMIGFHIAAGVSVMGTIMGAISGLGLLVWILALTPMAVYCLVRCRPQDGLPLVIMAAWALWARGNTIVANYDASQFPTLDFATEPAILALWRLAGVALAAWGLSRAFAAAGSGVKMAMALPLGLAVGIGAVLVGLIEVPLAAWDESRVPVNKVAVGSLLRAQATEVQIMAHVVAAASGLGAALALGRLLRPEWFQRRRSQATPVATAS